MVNLRINSPVYRSTTLLIAICAVVLQFLERANALPEEVATTLETKHSEINGVDASDRNDPDPQLLQTIGNLEPFYFSYTPLETTVSSSEPSLAVSDIEPLSETIPFQAQEVPVTPRAEPVEPLETLPSQVDQLFTQATDAQEPRPEETVPEEPRRFGEAGQGYWYIQGAGAGSFDHGNAENEPTVFGLAGVGISQFFANGHSINAELNTMGFIQPDEDALGLNLSVLLRSHLYRQPNWSLYIDGGAGILGTTSAVPTSGSQFNFTPQVGIGATINLGGAEHLMVGLRWHHISNANLYDSNPGLDSIMLYGGWIMPR